MKYMEKVLRTIPVFSVHMGLLMVSVYLQIKLIYRNCFIEKGKPRFIYMNLMHHYIYGDNHLPFDTVISYLT